MRKLTLIMMAVVLLISSLKCRLCVKKRPMKATGASVAAWRSQMMLNTENTLALAP